MLNSSIKIVSLAAIVSLAVLTQPTEAASKGLAWGTNNNWAKKIAKGHIKWYHHWQNAAVSEMPSDVQYVPMDWGPKYNNLWSERKKHFSKHKPQYVLAFNEPDVSGQSDMSPSSAASRYLKELEPLRKKGIKVSSPQIVYNTKWMDSFLKQIRAKGSDVDFMAIHYYGSWKDPKRLQKFVTTIRNKYHKSIWVTEFGVTAKSHGSTSQIKSFRTSVTNWMDSKSYVKRVAWLGCFAVSHPPDDFASRYMGMFSNGGSLNKMGISYVYKRDAEEEQTPAARSTPGAKRHNLQHHKRIIANGIHQAADLARRNASEPITINGHTLSEEEMEEWLKPDEEEHDDIEDPDAEHCDEICQLRDADVEEHGVYEKDDDLEVADD
jgi:hypothetical protein